MKYTKELTTYAASLALVTTVVGGEMIQRVPGVSSEQAAYWQQIMETRDLQRTLELFTSKETAPSWPQVVSAQCRSEMTAEQRGIHGQFRDLARELLQELEELHESVPEMETEEFIHNMTLLLQFRDHLASRLSYINLLMVEITGRVVFANLSKHIVHSRWITPEVDSLITRLRCFDLDPLELVPVVEQEVGRSLEGVAQDTLLPPELLFSLMQICAGAEDIESTVNRITPRFCYELLDSCDIPSLLWMCHVTDYDIQLGLPLTALYIGQNPYFSPADTYHKVKAALSLSEAERSHYGSPFSPCGGGCEGEVRRLMGKVISGRMEWRPGFRRPTFAEGESLLTKADAERTKRREIVKSIDWEEIGKNLLAIDNAKSELSELNGLSKYDSIAVEQLEAIIERRFPVESDGGRYIIGKVGEKPVFRLPWE